MNGLSKNDRISNYRGWMRPYRSEEFQESDVWDVAMATSRDEEPVLEEYYSNSELQQGNRQRDDNVEDGDKEMNQMMISSGVLAPAPAGVLLSRRLPSPTTMIPANNKRPQAGLMQVDIDHFSNYNRVTQQHSAPVTIPDWSKIYGPGECATMRRDFYGAESDDEDDIEEDESYNTDDGCNYKRREVSAAAAAVVVPPHEWLARRNEMPSFSVCEGAGRTLKGRDLRRVRNAVLARTGFL